MMSKKQWFVLLCLFIIYMLLGASIFFYVESEEEVRKSIKEMEEREIIEELLKKHYKGDNKSVEFIFNRLTDYCGKPVHYHMSEDPPDYKWDFYNSLFFVITVVSTIGYGNLVPTTMFTRIFMIFYALIGIPMNGIVMVTLGDYFGKSFTKLYTRWKSTKIERSSAKLGLVGQIILYSVPGFTFFMFLPATIMSVFEGWTYLEAIYYCFVSLTTIGFGDFVAGTNNDHGFGPEAYAFYKIFLLVWVIGGLGYVVMVLGFITKGMQSKHVVEIEKMLAENIKKTPQKIRDELRHVLQEFLFLRVKPVYKFDYVPQVLQRSQSCPDLQLWRDMDSPTMMRKRAMSECYKPILLPVLQRVQSETDLEMIDKDRTFKPTEAFMQQKDLLLKVVDALSGATAEENVLSAECPEDAVPTFKAKRRRAVSDIRPPSNVIARIGEGYTWYGNDASKAFSEFNKQRQRTYSTPGTERSERQNLFQRIRNRLKIKDDKNVDIEKQAVDNRRRGSTLSARGDLSRRRYSTLSTTQEQVLEQTSIADFIRALTAITVPETTFETEPRRKIGLGTLTPPDVIAARRRRMSIRTNFNNRRASLVPPPAPRLGGRRFSLRPVDENLLASPPPYSAFPPEARNSMRVAQGRKFSVRPAYINLPGPVKKQVTKRDRTDTE